MSKKKIIALSIGIPITLFALWFTTREVKWDEFFRLIRGFKWAWLIPALATFYYSMHLRGVRWAVMYRPHHDFTGRQMFAPVHICFAFNNLFPARVGEFVRCFYVAKKYKTGLPTALATLASERVFDGLCLLGMLIVSFQFLPDLNDDFSIRWGKYILDKGIIDSGMKAIVLLSLVVTIAAWLFMVPWVQLQIIRVIRRVPKLSHGLKLKLEHAVDQAARGFHSLRDFRNLVIIVFYTILIWLLVAISNICISKGFGVPMDIWQGMAMMSLIAFAILIPAAPGYWGLYETGGVFALVVLGVVRTSEQSMAFAITLMTHVIQYVPLVIIGLFFAWKANVKPVEDAEVIEEGLQEAGEIPADSHG